MPIGTAGWGFRYEKRNHLTLWLVLFPLLAVAAVSIVISANQNFSIDIFLSYLSQVQPVWLAAAVGCTLCYILFEGLSLHVICRRLGSPLPSGAQRHMVCGRYFLLRRHTLCHWWTTCRRLVYAPERGTGLGMLRCPAF